MTTENGLQMERQTTHDAVGGNAIRISSDEGLDLLRNEPLHDLGRRADAVREQLHGNVAYYNVNRHINYSNICRSQCRFCSFSRKPDDEGAFELTLKDILERAQEAAESGATELHIVGGNHPSLPFEFYLDMLRELSRQFPSLHLKCFTASEIDHFSQISGLEIHEILHRLVEAGLNSMPGGGAEVASDRIRRALCPDKISMIRWLDIHQAAHRMGIPTNATMLYGHIETEEEIIQHLQLLREAQDKTGGFQAFVPLAYHPQGNRLGGRGPSGLRSLRIMAISRLMLDNVPHMKAYWVMLGTRLAQVALCFGADDLDGTVVDERITHMAGATSPRELTVREIRAFIEETGRIPVERTSLYEPCEMAH